MNKVLTIFLITGLIFSLVAQTEGKFSIARLKYDGGGDWYNDPSAEVNLLNFVQQNTNIKVNAKYQFVDISSDEMFSFPFLFLTGHGNIVFSRVLEFMGITSVPDKIPNITTFTVLISPAFSAISLALTK